MKKQAYAWAILGTGAAIAAALAISCGGGSGGGGGGTRFNGTVSSRTASLLPQSSPPTRFAWLSLVGTAFAQGVGGVHVCLQGSTTLCTDTDENGSFSLPVEGDLDSPCLEFSRDTASLGTVCINGFLANGSVITIDDIECEDGVCTVGDVDVEEVGEDPSQEVSDEDTPSDPSGVSEPSSPDDKVDDVSAPDDNSGKGNGNDDNSGDDDNDDVSGPG